MQRKRKFAETQNFPTESMNLTKKEEEDLDPLLYESGEYILRVELVKEKESREKAEAQLNASMQRIAELERMNAELRQSCKEQKEENVQLSRALEINKSTLKAVFEQQSNKRITEGNVKKLKSSLETAIKNRDKMEGKLGEQQQKNSSLEQKNIKLKKKVTKSKIERSFVDSENVSLRQQLHSAQKKEAHAVKKRAATKEKLKQAECEKADTAKDLDKFKFQLFHYHGESCRFFQDAFTPLAPTSSLMQGPAYGKENK